ncbi:dienelactone hydrolase family protein [Sporichthya sp.]|uniref:dienelactone hydrolase family protein n=1 Tax=Sporichthya sp. TaxID=65475 RepID=UPI001792DAD5|nr:dienelactone hydrolase family protein [Sporichthya sp.]MBA3742163.1 dienelactone hydrolase family protein [Sporichthya sp.]
MAHIALFHSILGVRPGELDAARRFTEAGHEVRVVDQYDGEVFDDYEDATQYARTIGYHELVGRALASTLDLPDNFVVVGFSNGAVMAEYVALHRPVSGALLINTAVEVAEVGGQAWPSDVPVQVHHSMEDQWKEPQQILDFVAQVQAANAAVEVFDYPKGGHVFTDPSKADEYDEAGAELFWQRALEFCAKL